jgi:PRTRC genetic system ThiF family protein
MQQHFADAEPFVSLTNTPAGAPSVHAARRADSYAISVDTLGRLRWTKNQIDGDHIICVLSECVPTDYLAMLRSRGKGEFSCGCPDRNRIARGLFADLGNAAMIHTLDPQLLERPIRLLVVGCGGNGSAVVSELPYLHQALLAFDHPGGLAVTVIDPDAVSETNCVRQPFCRIEIGLSKAITLVHRINSFWGLNWQGMQATIQQIPKGAEIDLVIGCVDTRKARRAIDARARKSRVLYWLDLGNSASTGQFILGQPSNALNRQKKNRLPAVAELYPEILAPDDKHDRQPACSAAEALTR